MTFSVFGADILLGMPANRYINVFRIQQLLTGFLVLLWVYASLTKLFEFTVFREQMERQVLPEFTKPILTYLLPVVELLIAIALTVQFAFKTAVWTSLTLLAAFTIYIGLAVFKVLPRHPCSCGGIISHLGWNWHLIFNIFCLTINSLLIYTLKKGGPDTD